MKLIIMKYFIFLLIIIVVTPSCKKQFDFENKIVGKWQIESIKKEKSFLKYDDISNSLGYKTIVFNDNQTVQLFLNDVVQPIEGNWKTSYETSYNYSTNDDGTGTPNCIMKIAIIWTTPPDYLSNVSVGTLTNHKMTFYFEDKNKQIVFKCKK